MISGLALRATAGFLRGAAAATSGPDRGRRGDRGSAASARARRCGSARLVGGRLGAGAAVTMGFGGDRAHDGRRLDLGCGVVGRLRRRRASRHGNSGGYGQGPAIVCTASCRCHRPFSRRAAPADRRSGIRSVAARRSTRPIAIRTAVSGACGGRSATRMTSGKRSNRTRFSRITRAVVSVTFSCSSQRRHQ